MRKYFIITSIFFMLVSLRSSGEILSDNTIGYSISLPDGWIRQIVDSTHHIFEDTTDAHKSLIGIKLYNLQEFQPVITEKEWTELNFWTYYLWVSVESTNVIIYLDTLISTQNNNRFTTDIYTYFFDTEGATGDIAEYIRYTAAGNRGFEIYAIGPLNDIDTNLNDYVKLIDSITVTTLKNEVIFVPYYNKNYRKKTSYLFYPQVDLLGRNIKNRKIASYLFFSSKGSSLLIK